MTAAPAKEEKVDHAFYEELQNQLKEALNTKKAADKALSSIEDQIEKFEGNNSLSCCLPLLLFSPRLLLPAAACQPVKRTDCSELSY